MISLYTYAVSVFSLAAVFITFCITYLLYKRACAHADCKKINEHRLQAYTHLNNTLAIAAISSGESDKLYHSLFFSAEDFFRFKGALAESHKRAFWFSKTTLSCLSKYIQVFEAAYSYYGLTPDSANTLFQEFGIEYYPLFNHYQNKLLSSIQSDMNTMADVNTFLGTEHNSSHVSKLNHIINFTAQPADQMAVALS